MTVMILSILGLTANIVMALETPTAKELLDNYAQTQNKQQSYICKWQCNTQCDALLTEPPYTALFRKE